MRQQRDVVGLQRIGVAVHVVAERRVHEMLDAGTLRNDVCSVTAVAPLSLQTVAHAAIGADVGAAEAIDRLLRIADDEQRARPDACPSIVAREQQQQLGLQRIGVLELVDQDDAEALSGTRGRHRRVVADQIARLDQQIEKVERAGPCLRSS